MFDATVREGVLRLRRPGTEWLSTGHDGGRSVGGAAYNLSVPEGWNHKNVTGYIEDRLEGIGFDEFGPALLTGVEMRHCRGARTDHVEAYATAGVSNPAALPSDPSGDPESLRGRETGTVNVIVGTTRALNGGALAELLAGTMEAKTATLLAETGFPGTTSDAAIIACDPDGEPADYTGSATIVGSAARACVREAVTASLRSRYPDRDYPDSVADAEYGVRTNRRAELFKP